MSENEGKRLAEAMSAFKELRRQCRSLVLATTDSEGLPSVSYAPYVCADGGDFFVYVSGLSAHTRHLVSLRMAAVLLIEDESRTKQIFARRRIAYRCRITPVDRADSVYEIMLDRLATRFGGVVGVLRTLPDFRMFQLSPVAGRFVTGFGQAYELGGEDLSELVHISAEQLKRS